VLSALDPSSGAPGQIVVITGTNFVSPSGQITVNFGAQTAIIACPEQTGCLVSVPPAAGTTASVPVTVTTDGGTSNPLTFTYT
jgi:IPT/TIG domain